MVKADTSNFQVWESKKYYLIARKAILETNDFGLSVLRKYAFDAKRVLDVGCGEGSRLQRVLGDKKGYGVEISDLAIKMAKYQYPKHNFYKIKANNFPFRNNYFDLVYSAYVLEHVQEPENFLSEVTRVLKRKGKMILIAPNFGSPNRASPNYRGSRVMKLIKGTCADLMQRNYESALCWKRVHPIWDIENYEKDSDTTTEPYLRSLLGYLKLKDFKILEYSSVWEDELGGAKIHQKIFRVFSHLNIYPFIYWGPKMIVVAEKL